MQKITKLSLLILFITFSANTVFSQDIPDEGSVGITASFQGNQTNIMLPIWVSNHVVVAPLVGLEHRQDNYTTVNIGIKPRFYQSLGYNFASYFGLAGLVNHTSPDAGDNTTNFIIGINGGGEYYLSEHFGVGVEAQLNFLIADESNNVLSTGAAITGSYYF
ncbi:MAG TPA: hypothetical protein VK106_04220 [Balneolaceae bacterium]|nr:hypothetical protein [Balneolaceae bacterium]